MPGTPNNFRLTGRVLGPGLLWGNLTIPAAGSRLMLATVDADGFITPDITANPNAVPLGATADGVVCKANVERQDFSVDEINGPVDTKIQQVMMSLEATLRGVADAVVAKIAMAGFGTQTTGTGYVENAIGFATDVFSSVALIAPMRDDPTKVFVFHIYKAINQNGIDFSVKKSELAGTPVNFKGYAVSTRTPSDQFGKYWWQT